MTRCDRRGCNYDAYLPDPLIGWPLTLPGDVAADIADAETAIRDLNQAVTTHVSLEGLARFLLRAESVASSKIEGLDAGARRLVEAQALLVEVGGAADRVAVEILGNIASMESAIELADQQRDMTLTDLLGIHQTLMERSPSPELGGRGRKRAYRPRPDPHHPSPTWRSPPPALWVRMRSDSRRTRQPTPCARSVMEGNKGCSELHTLP